MINILFGGNYKVFDGMLLCLMSMAKHTKETLNVYILTADVTNLNEEYKPIPQSDADFLQDYLQKYNPQNQVHLITLGQDFNDWVSNSKNKISVYTPFAFLRLFADKIEELPNKIIYLDTDMMINGDIKELFDIDISNYEIGVVKDYLGRIFIRPSYFNSGMLLMNMEKIRETNLFEKVKQMCVTKKMAFPDQDALNRLAKFKLYLPRRFNEQRNPKDDTVIQHFCKRLKSVIPLKTINVKPWHIEQVQNVYKVHNYDDVYEEFKQIKNTQK